MEYPKVTEVQNSRHRETDMRDNFIDEYSHELGWRTGAEYCDYLYSDSPVEETLDLGFDYSNQLEFHKQEVAEAPKRGMPQAQVDYHLGKIAVLENQPRPPQGPPPEQHKLDCKKDEGSCSCGK